MMKTRKYIAVIFAAMVMGISGCNDDLFLEEHPDTFYTAEVPFPGKGVWDSAWMPR